MKRNREDWKLTREAWNAKVYPIREGEKYSWPLLLSVAGGTVAVSLMIGMVGGLSVFETLMRLFGFEVA